MDMNSSLTFISIIATLIAIIVALSVAYNFIAIGDLRKKVESLEREFSEKFNNICKDFENKHSELHQSLQSKISSIQTEIDKFNEMNKVYAQLMYEVNNANAKFKYNDNCIFETIIEELKNIYHVICHKECFTTDKFKEIIAAKYWFIANDILRYSKDKYIVSTDNGERNKLITQRDDIIKLCNTIQMHPNAVDVEKKLTPIFFVVRNLIDDLYYGHQIKETGENWEIVRRIAQ